MLHAILGCSCKRCPVGSKIASQLITHSEHVSHYFGHANQVVLKLQSGETLLFFENKFVTLEKICVSQR